MQREQHKSKCLVFYTLITSHYFVPPFIAPRDQADEHKHIDT